MFEEINILIFPFFIEYLVILNVYNGDLINIPESIEYCLWYLLSLIFYVLKERKLFTKAVMVLALGCITNIFWYFANPWIKDNDKTLLCYPDNKAIDKDSFFNNVKLIVRPRHRTEFYVSHGALSCYLFSVIFNN